MRQSTRQLVTPDERPRRPISHLSLVATRAGALILVLVVGLSACAKGGSPRLALPTPVPTEVLDRSVASVAAAAGEHLPVAATAPRPPAPTPTARPIPPGYLHAAGSKLVDARGNEVILTGINWFGLETGTYAPHGLWSRRWTDMLDVVARLGYNVIRLPYSNQALDPNSQPLEGIDFDLNPDLRGLSGLQIMDKIIQGAGQRGIKVILDRHRPTPTGQSKLWYTDEVPEEQWISDWQALARRYKDNDTVVGADLHNEPAGDATWGDGNPKTDWRLAAERAGNAILSVNPNWLIIVEGVEKTKSATGQDDWYWMGGSLQGVARAPVRLDHPDKLVYSAHDYGPGVFNQGWFQAKEFPANLPAIWDAHWGYIAQQGIAPVLVGEFGGRSVGQDAEGVWQRSLIDYMKRNGISYTYWSLNPNSGDTGGILDDDWQTVVQAKQDLLATYLAPKVPIANYSAVDTAAVVAPRQRPLPERRVKVLFRTTKPDANSSELAVELQVVNQTDSRVPLENVKLSYWFAAPGLSASAQTLSVDWASVDGKLLQLAVVPDGRAGQTYRLDVGFGKGAPMIAARGNAEVKLRLKRADQSTYDQSQAFSFKPLASYGENPRIALYFWGERIWGEEPGQAGG